MLHIAGRIFKKLFKLLKFMTLYSRLFHTITWSTLSAKSASRCLAYGVAYEQFVLVPMSCAVYSQRKCTKRVSKMGEVELLGV